MTLVVAQAEATGPRMALFSAAARSAVRYADPMSWTAATAVSHALANLDHAISDMRDSIGVMTIGDNGPAQTIAAVAEASAAGFSSPMRYPASNPGSLAGVICITHGLRGPTINFVMPPALGIPTAHALANAWIERHGVPLVVLLASTRIAEDKYLARCLLLAPRPLEGSTSDALNVAHSSWLTTTS